MAYRCRVDSVDLTDLVERALAEQEGLQVLAGAPAAPRIAARVLVTCPVDGVENVFATGGDPAAELRGVPPGIADVELRKASAELVVKSEERGRDLVTALLGQVAVVALFLAGFGLLGDEQADAVVASPWSLVAIVSAAAALALSLGALFLPPWAVPSLDNLSALQDFWNGRVRNRRALLAVSGLALIVAIASAVVAFADARDTTAREPAAALEVEVVPSRDTAWTVRVSAAWSGLDGAERVLTCLEDSSGRVLARLEATADQDGATSSSATLPLPAPVVPLVATSVRLTASARVPAATDTCELPPSARAGEPARVAVDLG